MNRASTTNMTLTLVLITSFAMWFSSCKKDDPDPLADRMKLLSGTWTVSSVENNDMNVTGQYAGFTLTFNGKNYTTTNGGNPWPASGMYEIKKEDLNTILRSDGTTISIVELTKNTLVLSFTHNTVTGGRINGVTGGFIFSLIK